MHYPIVCYVQGQILKIEGALLLVPALTGLLYMALGVAAYALLSGQGAPWTAYLADLAMGTATGGIIGAIVSNISGK